MQQIEILIFSQVVSKNVEFNNYTLGSLGSIPEQFWKKIKYAGITERTEHLQTIVSLG